MAIEWNVTLLAAAGVGLLLGIGLGMLLRGRSGAADRARAEQLESELEQTREDLTTHRDDVARHFQETSDLFRNVTEQYTRLYAHLAAGARSFSVDEVPAIGRLDTPLIGTAPPVEGAEAGDEAHAAGQGEADETEPAVGAPPTGARPDAKREGDSAGSSAAATESAPPLA